MNKINFLEISFFKKKFFKKKYLDKSFLMKKFHRINFFYHLQTAKKVLVHIKVIIKTSKNFYSLYLLRNLGRHIRKFFQSISSPLLFSRLCYLTLLFLSYDAHASFLSEQTDKMFDDIMTNTTSGGYYESSRRGVLSGGSIMTRNPILDLQLISFAAPHVNAGCGGIDLFAGSFSFANSDQLIQVMRSVASNAAGYAFALALGEMSPEILSVVQWLHGLINQLNMNQSSSCQIAQGLVNDLTGSFWSETNRARTSASVAGSVSGWFSDFNDAMYQSGKDNVLSTLKFNDETSYNQIVAGNVIYQALSNSNVPSAFGYSNKSSGIEEIMAVTGTLIVDLKEQQQSGADEELSYTVKPPLIEFKDLLNADSSYKETVYKCNDDNCLSVSAIKKSEAGFSNMRDRILKILCGNNLDGGEDSVIYKYAHAGNPELELTSQQKALLDNSRTLALAMHDLVLSGNTDLLREFVFEYATVLSAQTVKELIGKVFQASRQALSQSPSKNVGRAMEVLNNSERDFNEDCDTFLKEHGGLRELDEHLNALRLRIDHHHSIRDN